MSEQKSEVQNLTEPTVATEPSTQALSRPTPIGSRTASRRTTRRTHLRTTGSPTPPRSAQRADRSRAREMARVEGLVGFGQDLLVLVRDAPAVPAPATVVRQAHRIRRSSTCAVARETTSIAHGVSWGIRLAKSVLGVTLPQTRGQLPLQVARAPIASRVARVGAGVARTWPGLASSMSGTPTPGMGSLRSRHERASRGDCST